MKVEQARTGLDQQIDVTDPKWRKAREALWRKEIGRHHKGDGLPYAHTEQYKRVFMGEIEFVPEGTDLTEKDDDRYLSPYGLGWEMSPLQNCEKWRWAILERPPAFAFEQKLLEEGRAQLIEYRISRLTEIWRHGFEILAGWSVSIAAELVRYISGETYVYGERDFEGYRINPLISPSYLFQRWLGTASGAWLGLRRDEPTPPMAWMFVDYFFSLIDYVHPVFFSGKQSSVLRFSAAVKCLSSVRNLANVEAFFDDAKEFPDGRDLGDEAKDARRKVVAEFRERVLALPAGNPFRRMWEEAVGKPLIWTAPRHAGNGRLLPEEEPEFISISNYEHMGCPFIPPYIRS